MCLKKREQKACCVVSHLARLPIDAVFTIVVRIPRLRILPVRVHTVHSTSLLPGVLAAWLVDPRNNGAGE